jgi:2-keto-4-pentenoate hydratase/2-oxohepta-3-ene-1,7-dioic acid hydratase in catechol pathway
VTRARPSKKLPKPTYPFPPKGDPLIANLDRLKPAILAAAESGASFPVSEVKFRSPVAAPTKIIGTPTHYRDHIAEADRQREVFGRRYSGSIAEQGLFLKATSALVGPGEGVRLRFPDRRTADEVPGPQNLDLHAMARRHHHERHLLGGQPGKAGRCPALRDRQGRPLRCAHPRMRGGKRALSAEI